MFWFFGHTVCRILAPWPGIEPTTHALEGEALTIALPGKSPNILFLKMKEWRWQVWELFGGNTCI